jgi:hypothetical protein
MAWKNHERKRGVVAALREEKQASRDGARTQG